LRSWIFSSRKNYAYAPFALAALVAVCFAAIIVFVARPIEPFGYYKDLGFDHMVTDWAAHDVNSPLDFIDTLGWSPWGGTQLFYLNSYAPVLLSASLSKIAGNTWLAIKIIQLLEVMVAATSAFALYRTARRSTFWACAFALTYAAIPTTTLAIRGNVGFGWIAALLPASIAIGRLLVFRFGPRAFPVAGIVCGLFGYVIAIEYLAFVSLPALAIIIASAPLPDRRWTRRYALLVPLAFVCTAAIGAFFVLPTFWHPLFSDAAARTSTLVTGAFLGNFSETAVGLLTLVPRESLASPLAQFNATASLPILYAAGTCWWLGAIAFLVRSHDRLAFCNTLCVLIVVACTVLALGEEIPGGHAIWSVLFLLPHVDAIRTTDRFIAIPALFVVFWATLGLESFIRSKPWFRAAAAWIAVAVFASAVAFDAVEHCFSVEPTIGERMPHLNEVRQRVLAIGGRTASFASVNGGSREDAEEYGLPAPVEAAYLDLGSRYFLDGIGASGVLGRAAVRSVITSPNWSYDTPELPPSTDVYRHVSRATAVFDSPENVRVWRISARDMLGSARVDCIFGGPGAFDELEAAPAFAGDSFAEPGARCASRGLIDFEPADDWPNLAPLAHWSGAALFPSADRVRDADYPYLLNRVLLALPWYRNSIGGARPEFDVSGAARIDDATSTVNASTPWPPGSTIAIRLAAPNGGTIAVKVSGVTQQRALVADPRLRWYRFRLDRAVQPRDVVTLTLGASKEPLGTPSSYSGIAVDGLAVLPRAIPAVDYAPAFAVISTDELEAQARIPAADAVAGRLELISMTGLHPEFDGENQILSVDASQAVARYRWRGSSGAYELQASADNTMADALLTIASDCCIGRTLYDPANGKRTVAVTRANLHDGSVFSVRLSSRAFDPAGSASISAVKVRPVEPFRLNGTAHQAELDFQTPFIAMSHLRDAAGTLTPAGLEGVPGTRIAFDLVTDPHSDTIVASVARLGDGVGVLTFDCGAATSTSIVTPVFATATFAVGGASRCHGRLEWRSGWFILTKLTLRDTGARRRQFSGDAWLPAGRFRTTLLARDGTQEPVNVRARGCRRDVCSFATNGYRATAFEGSSSGGQLILLRDGDRPAAHEPAVQQTAAIRWRARLLQTSDLVLAQLFDGNWRAEGNGRVFNGERCDITSTCFPHLAPGTYRIYHVWSPALVAGTIVTFLTATLAAMLILPLPQRFRSSGASRRR
jgi:hypothetical protein